MSWQQTWSSGTTYNLNDGVQYQGSGFISLVGSNLGNTPGAQSTTQGVAGSTCGTSCQWSLIAQASFGLTGTTNNGGNVTLSDTRIFSTSVCVCGYTGGTDRTDPLRTTVSAGSCTAHGDKNAGVACIVTNN